MSKFLVLFEKSTTGYGAYAPDLPGCVATGRTLDETRGRMAKAMEMHLSAMREDGDPIPEPSHFELVGSSLIANASFRPHQENENNDHR